MDGSCIHEEKVAFKNENGYVSTGPQGITQPPDSFRNQQVTRTMNIGPKCQRNVNMGPPHSTFVDW